MDIPSEKILNEELSALCLTCGMCCDGTLFNKATIQDDADEKIALNLGLTTFSNTKGERFFKLPCHHFKKCCTIYDKERPSVCHTYFCKPLRDVRNGKLELTDAKNRILKAVSYRAEVLAIAAQTEVYQTFTIRQLIEEILPNPTEQIKQHPNLWLKLIGLYAIVGKLSGTKKSKK